MSKANLEKLFDIKDWVNKSIDFDDSDKIDLNECVDELYTIFKSVNIDTRKSEYAGVPPKHCELVQIVEWLRNHPSISQDNKNAIEGYMNRVVLIVKKVIGNQTITGRGSIT